jgi:riboflavin synthase
MFTGIIEQTGRIASLKPHGAVQRLTVDCPGIAGRLREGDSLAVSGVCLTALEVNAQYFHADLAAETLALTTLAHLEPGALVNLEMPTVAGAPLGGHIVQGHVDGTGTLVSLIPVHAQASPDFDPARTDWRMTVHVPKNLHRYIIPKGSIAIEGISLTIAATDIPQGGATIEIAVLPLTWARTNLHALAPGAPVNLEADILIKSAAQQEQIPDYDLTESWLVANGF